MDFYDSRTDAQFEVDHKRLKREIQREVCRLFGVEPWLAGIGRKPPFPLRVLRRLTGRRYYPWP